MRDISQPLRRSSSPLQARPARPTPRVRPSTPPWVTARPRRPRHRRRLPKHQQPVFSPRLSLRRRAPLNMRQWATASCRLVNQARPRQALLLPGRTRTPVTACRKLRPRRTRQPIRMLDMSCQLPRRHRPASSNRPILTPVTPCHRRSRRLQPIRTQVTTCRPLPGPRLFRPRHRRLRSPFPGRSMLRTSTSATLQWSTRAKS